MLITPVTKFLDQYYVEYDENDLKFAEANVMKM